LARFGGFVAGFWARAGKQKRIAAICASAGQKLYRFFTVSSRFFSGQVVEVFPAPRNERGLGDIEFRRDAGKPALDAEVNETLNGFVFVHTVLSEPAVEVGDCQEAALRTFKPAIVWSANLAQT
jgi:hypothetical protein